MSESVKTITFVLAGALAITLAVVSQPSRRTTDVQQFVGTVLNKDIDIAAPRRLQIARFDRGTAEVRQFEVAEVDGVWSIPSKDNYPADAVEQMAEAATCLVDRKILRVADESAMSHEKYGVIDPLSPKLDAKSVGVGTHVTMTDADNNKLVDMIIGKTVSGSPGQRYVRRPSQNVVFVVELDPSKLTTNFDDWIEDDLLKLNEMDLRQVQVDDYTADFLFDIGQDGRPVLQVGRDLRAEMTLGRDAEGSPWTVAKLLKGGPEEPPRYVDDQMAEDEEVNQQAINDLVTGLNELLIVDVAKKPDGLSADLKAGQAFLTNQEALISLLDKGFCPTPGQTSGAELIASEGEVVCTLRNGVVYELLFGQLQIETDGDAEGDEDDAAEEPGADGADPAAADPADAAAVDPAAAQDEATATASATEKSANSDDKNLRRYLFVRARFDEDAVEKPEYKELPPLPAEDNADEPAATDEGATAAADDGDESTSEESAGDDAAADDDASDEDANGSEDEAATDDADDAKQAEDRAAIEAERKQIEEDNDRIREEYESLIAEGQDEVKSLNRRFGDWYFVISNDVYKKLHLGRDQVIKKKEAPTAEGEGAAAPNAAGGMPGLPDSLIPAGAAPAADAPTGETP